MDTLQSIIDLYTRDSAVQAISNAINSGTSFGRFEIKKLIGAQSAFVQLALTSQIQVPQLIVLNTKEEAAYWHNTLTAISENQRISFFCDSFKRPMLYDELNAINVLQRTEVVNRLVLSTNTNRMIVTYPEALFEKVVAPEVLEKNKIVLTMDESLDVDSMIEIMVEFGFHRVDFVYEPGQFSIRGGIIDIFSFGSEWPYRIELFDDEIESIRTFNPTTQLSVRNIKKVAIIPNVNAEFDSDQKVSIFDILEEKSIIWVKDHDHLLDQLMICFEKAKKYITSIPKDQVELLKALEKQAFVFPKDILAALELHHVAFENKGSYTASIQQSFAFESSPQPNFNKNFKLLIDNFRENAKKGIKNFIFTENIKQIERFYSIFEDLQANVQWTPIQKGISEGFIDQKHKIALYTDHQIFERFHRYTLRQGFTKEQAISLKMVRELKRGDYVTHIDHGIGMYSGLEKININGQEQESVRLRYKNNDMLYVSINSLHKISRYVGKDGTKPTLSKIGGEAWKALKRKTKKKVKDIAKELIKLYAKRKSSPGHEFPQDGYLQNELEASFLYEDTPDQYKATQDVKEDMMKPYPMDRLICGDVGFGKTEIAIRAAFKAVVDGKQVAVLVPTTILALQHFKTFSARLRDFGVTVDYINRFRTTKEKNALFERLKTGEVDLVIGTHGLLNKKVGFKDLGLLIIDEEQKFGVAAKEKLRSIKVNVDTLTLTATPIPRTLQFSLMAARDMSIIRTPPPNRQPIHTERRVFHEELIRDAIYYEINRGGQVFFVHNRVKSIPDITTLIRKVCPDLKIAMAHGQMESKVLEKTLLDFIEKQFDVLVCTNIIETGLDIPNANTIIINNANHFGLSDLHQLRGRVGRSNQKAFCYLLAPPLSVLTPDAKKRLKTLEDFSDLGSGFNIAMRDLDIRGAGNLLGGEQSGFISDIGFDTYQKILEEAIHELKESDFKDVFADENATKRDYVRDVEIEADIELLIPDDYISVVEERLSIYTEMDAIEDEETLEAFKAKLKDRFGKIPKEVENLFNGLRVRWYCKKLGIERLTLKNQVMRGFFVGNPQSSFYESPTFQKILAYVSKFGQRKGISLKQSLKFLILIQEEVDSLQKVRKILERIVHETNIAEKII